MATAIIMPRQGNTVESCIVSKWHKQKGDKVNEGDILFTYETDKATFDEESPVSGTLLALLYEEGDDVPVLENMCVIGEEGEDISQFLSSSPVDIEKKEEKLEQVEAVKETVVETQPSLQERKEGDLKISPRAKNAAKKTNVDIGYAQASGPEGRIIERDIIALAKDGPKVTSAAKALYDSSTQYVATGIGGRITQEDIERGAKLAVDTVKVEKPALSQDEFTVEKLTNIRKVIAKTMHRSISEMAQLTINMSFDATALMNYRAMIKARGEKVGLSNITLNDMVVFAVSRTLPYHQDLNAHFDGESIKRFSSVHMGVAIDTDRGLMVPTVFNSHLKTLDHISLEVKELAGQSRAGNINPDLLTGGTFTITNLGNLGVESFAPIINPPQTAVLGVCGLSTKVKEEGGQIKAYQAMALSLTIDHRVVDGAPAARFLRDLCDNLENFEILLAK